jgi:hypothetical protein
MKLNRADLMERVTSLMSAAVALLPILAVSAGGAYAEEQPVASDKTGTITIDTDSVQPRDEYVRAGFWAYAGDSRVPVIALIEGCEKHAGTISYTVIGAQEPDNAIGVSTWNIAGHRMVDKMAASACQHAKRG